MHTQHLGVDHPLINAKTPPSYLLPISPALETLPGYYLSLMQGKQLYLSYEFPNNGEQSLQQTPLPCNLQLIS